MARVVCSANCIVASIHGAVLGWFGRFAASGDLGMFCKRGREEVARMHFVSQTTLSMALAETAGETIPANPKRARKMGKLLPFIPSRGGRRGVIL